MHPQRSALSRLLLLADAIVIVLSMLASFLVHGWLRELTPLLRAPPDFRHYAALAALALPLWIVLDLLLGLDRAVEELPDVGEVALRLAGMHALGLVGLSVLLFLTQSVINRSLVALFLLMTFFAMLGERLLLRYWLRYQHRAGHAEQRLLFVAPGPEPARHFEARAGADRLPPRLVGWLGPSTASSGHDAVPYLGEPTVLERVLEREAIDEVCFFPPYTTGPDLETAVDVLHSRGVAVSLAVSAPPGIGGAPSLRALYEVPFLRYEPSPKSPEALALKHALDLVVSLGALVLLCPVFLATALVILTFMGHPVLFAQERAGLRGRRFRMLKFRTMVHDAEARRKTLLERNETGGPAFKMTHDPRVTRVGRWLRRFSLDELPQLLNVVTGSMSLVGPRPLPIEEQSALGGWHRRRLSMKPGITGLWQVSGRNDLGFEEWMRLDLRYVDTWSLALDTWILLRTIPAVILARGSR